MLSFYNARCNIIAFHENCHVSVAEFIEETKGN